MKYLSISTCFILSCCTGLWLIAIVDVLSQYKFIVSFCLKPKSDSTFLIHKSSHTPSVMALNFASALDLAIIDYFLLLQVTRFSPTKVKYLEVDLLSSFEPTQFASVYPSTFKFPWFENKIPFPKVDFKYLKILSTTFIWSFHGSCINWLTTFIA